MKKKNLLTVIVSLALVAVLGVGATLAYISANDAKITNTFSFGNITVDLTEPKPTEGLGDAKVTEGQNGAGNVAGGWTYTNVVPGQTLPKAPAISVDTTVSAYVFVKVSGFDANLTCGAKTTGWTAIDSTVDEYGNGTYYRLVNGAEQAQNLGTIFTQVMVGIKVTTLSNVEIRVAAIQSAGFTTAAEALGNVKFQ